jgi:hypothetical protein
VLEAVKVWPSKADVCRKVGTTANLDSFCARRVSETTVGTKKQTFKSNKETDEEKRWTALLKLLD